MILNSMASKLWEKNVQVDHDVEQYTVGRDREMDLYLATYDVLGSMAHIAMLQSIRLLTADELEALTAELRLIYAEAEQGRFVIEEGVEDIHSQVELMLTRRLGDMGKKIHSGRSRNDQVLVDLRLFSRSKIEEVVAAMTRLFKTLQAQSERYRDVLMPGYTHLQVAMPSSFGLWFGAYAESLADDLTVMRAAYDITNRNPLGSAAGYGSSFPIDREMTTRLLGFASPDYNVVYAQMGRGKTERIVAQALAGVAATVSKLAFDACMFNSQNFGFLRLADEFTIDIQVVYTESRCHPFGTFHLSFVGDRGDEPAGSVGSARSVVHRTSYDRGIDHRNPFRAFPRIVIQRSYKCTHAFTVGSAASSEHCECRTIKHLSVIHHIVFVCC